MRIASMMMSHNYLRQLNGTYEQYAKLMEQSDGSKLHRASDDAVGYSKYLRYQNNKIGNEQYQANVSTATSWMKNSDAALVNVTGLLETFKAKVEQAANSPNNESDMRDIAKELLASVQEQVEDLNTQIGDRFLFAGQKDTTMPFTITDEKQSRGETITLDEKQQAFFSGADWGDENTTMKQMLKLKDDDGAVYYMNVQNGDIYSEDFVKNGYKDRDKLDVNDRVDCANEYRYTGESLPLQSKAQQKYFGCKELKHYKDAVGTGADYYADADGNLYDKTFVDDMVNMLGTPAANNVVGNLSSGVYTSGGTSLTLNDTQKAYFGTDTLTQYTDGTNIYYADDKGNLYSNLFLTNTTNGFITKTNDPAVNSSNIDLSSVNNFRVSDFFDSNGVVNTAGETAVIQKPDGSGDLEVNGKKLHLATHKQYIVQYHGDDKYISMVKKNGGVDQATDTANVTGQDLWGTDIFDVDNDPPSGTAMLNQLMYTVEKIDAADYHWAGEEGMTIADAAHASILGAETKMAARQQAYDAADGMLVTQNKSITGDISDVSSTNVAELATRLMEYQTIYSLSLSVGSKILPGTLADYL